MNKPAHSTEIGVIPAISDHYHAVPVNYDFDKIPIEKLSDKISRQYILGANSMLVRWFLKKGAVIPVHHHLSEQITWITQGSVEVVSQNKTYIVKAGGVLIIPAHVPHGFTALEDTIDIDIFSPVREDWLNGEATYINQIKSEKNI